VLLAAIKLGVTQDPEFTRLRQRFQTDQRQLRSILDRLLEPDSDVTNNALRVNIEGELVSPTNLVVKCDSPGVCWGNGYGPGGAYAAVLVVKAIRLDR
jgi:hypothetical protein